MAKRATQNDVAKLAGTSTAVVSYVINNGSRPVAPETRKRVLEAIKQTGYRPNNAARALLTGKGTTFGVVVPNLANPFLAHMLQSIEDEFYDHGYSLLVADSHDCLKREEDIIETMMSQQVAGLVWYSVDQPPPAHLLKDFARPVVFANACTPTDTGEVAGQRISVLEDERGSAADLTRELKKRGCRTIGHLGGPRGRINSAERSRGWFDALDDGSDGNPEDHPHHLSAPYTYEGGWQMAEHFVNLGCDGVVVSNEMQAVGLMARLASLGVRIPDDISVVAMHITAHAEYCVPALSGIHVDMADLSAQIATSLLGSGAAATIVPTTYFVERASC